MNLRGFLIGSIAIVGLFLSACGADRDGTGSDAPPNGQVQQPDEPPAPDAPYAFGEPDLSVALPPDLLEISGLAPLPDGRLAAIQDEEGILFILNPETGAVEEQEPFGDPADYEGIAWAGDRLFVLRSNGRLYELNGWPEGAMNVTEIRTPLRGRNDTEGLAYDPDANRLLIACKEEGGENLDEDVKAIYEFRLEDRSFNSTPVYQIDTNALEDETAIDSEFKPSAVAIHPQSGEVYVLSATASALVVMSSAGDVQHAWTLPDALFEQAEGLAFLPDGTLFISSEGQDGPGMLYRYDVR